MNPRIALVVDDSRSARFALRKQLEHHAFKVDTAESARAAYHWLATQKPDLIFLDHVMPGEDGFEALRRIKADPRTAAIPVVICSSNEGNSFVAEARSQGAADVLQKPPSPEQLRRVLQQVEAAIAAEADNAPIAAAELRTEGIARDLAEEPAAPAVEPPAPAAPAPSLPGDLAARIAGLEARIEAMEQRLVSDLASLNKQHKAIEALKKTYEKDWEELRRHYDAALEAAIRRAREQAVAEIRETLLRALRGPG